MKLAYDIGGFKGEDTERYLKLGYRVICIEADPGLTEMIHKRFAREIASGMCTVLNIAISDKNGTVPFFLSKARELSSLDRSRVDAVTYPYREVQIEARTTSSVFAEHGVPDLLKVDIEGADRHVILALNAQAAPQFVSFEMGKDDMDLVMHLHAIGYQAFNLIRQDTQISVTVPVAASLAYAIWSARQWFRLWLRRHPTLHGVARRAKGEYVGDGRAGPAPQERDEGWRDAARLGYDWVNIVSAGIADSTWFDVHARKGATETPSR
jgi:FkbM family methyltransferase